MTETSRPRVLMVGPLPLPLGGAQLMNQMLIGSSLRREFEIQVVNTSKNVLRWAVEAPSWRTLPYLVRDVARLVAALMRFRPQIVYVHAAGSLSFLRDWLFMALARLTGAKVVCHYHGTAHTKFPSLHTDMGRIIGRVLMRAAHHVIVVGPTYAREMGEAWHRDGDISWSPNLADIEVFRNVSPAEPAQWLAPGERAVLFVGRLSAPKGIFDLFDAIPSVIEQHPEVRFVLVGVAESDDREPMLRAEVARRGINERVTFLGSLEGRDKAHAYVSSTLIVVPSWTEAFPLVIPEAMAAGLPIVVTAVGAIPDFVTDGADGFLLPPHDPAALADRINRLLDDEPLRRAMAERVRERAPREFAIEVGACRVAEVLRGLLNRGMGERIPTANEMYFSEMTADATQMERLEEQFFQSVGLPNGTWKTTTYRRLDNLNELVQKFLPTDCPLEVMDVAVSSGVSTVEWIESMERTGAQCRMTAGDATADAYLVSIAPGMRVLVDRRGHALQYEVAGRGIGYPLRKRLMPVYLWPVLFIHLVLGMVVAPALRAATRLEEGGRLGTRWRPLKLVSPTLRKRNRIDVVEDDILVNRSYRERFDAVRAANIVNRGYFEDSTLTEMLTNLRNRLKRGGLLIVCRTNPQNVNHGTIFELREDDRLHVLARLNEGSEVEHLALALPPRT